MEIFKRYERWLTKQPIFSRSFTGFLLSFSGDSISQIIHFKIDGMKIRENYNIRRSLNMGLYIFAVICPALHYWFQFLSKKFPGPSWGAFWKKFLIDRIFVPWPMVLSVFTSQTLMNGGTLSDVKSRVEMHYLEAMKINYMVWPAAIFVQFRYIPLNFQVLYSNFIGFNWNIYLSWAVHKHKITYDEDLDV